MALGALVSAILEAEDGSGRLCAALPLAGQTVLERQVRRAVQAGAEYVIVRVERLPGDLLAAIDRLKKDDLRIEIARNVEDVIDFTHPVDKLLLVADGCLPDEYCCEAMVRQNPMAVLTVADGSGRDLFERIDATTRWAGLAIINGTLLRETSEMLGEWDFELTLLRRAVQQGSVRVDSEKISVIPVFAEDGASLQVAEKRVLQVNAVERTGWPETLIYPWLERVLIGPALGRFAQASIPGMLGLGIAIIGLIFTIIGWAWIGLGSYIVASISCALGRRMAAARLSALGQDKWIKTGLAIIATLMLAVLSFAQLVPQGGWGWAVITALIILLMIGLKMTRAALVKMEAQTLPLWIATPDALAFVMVPFILFGGWAMALAVVCVYALISYGWSQHLLLKELELFK